MDCIAIGNGILYARLQSSATHQASLPALITLMLSATLTVTSSMALEAGPCSELAHARSFSFGATVRAGKVVSREKAFSQVLHLPNPEDAFGRSSRAEMLKGKCMR
jgi:hypothetical protein